MAQPLANPIDSTTHRGLAEVEHIRFADLFDCLRRGLDDFRAQPSHYAFAGMLYPVVMIVLAIWISGQNILPLLFPIFAGFALLGPLVAVFFYEVSRRRESGLDTAWGHGVEALRSPALPAIAGLGLFLFALFALWLGTAQTLYQWLYGFEGPNTMPGFLMDVMSTQRGWTLIVLGNALGLVFAFIVLATTVIAFPMVLDRQGGTYDAIVTSTRALKTNPVQMIAWGLIVAAILLVAMIPLFIGLVVAMPVLGHATWHLYRRLVPHR